uniref:Uncharacterized protein n=1 Tax=viral metagenome TaxID=1070528 RepID=A0A6C0HDF3_9ZZZZ
MKLTKGKLSKIYNKKKQSMRKFKLRAKKSRRRKTFRKRKHLNLNRKTLKHFKHGGIGPQNPEKALINANNTIKASFPDTDAYAKSDNDSVVESANGTGTGTPPPTPSAPPLLDGREDEGFVGRTVTGNEEAVQATPVTPISLI